MCPAPVPGQGFSAGGFDNSPRNRIDHMTDTTTSEQFGGSRVKRGLAEMLKGGVIMDVVTAEQARIAEDAGAVAVMALERVPADIRSQGGVARMSDPDLIESIIAEVSIPVMAKARIGHFVEAQVLQALDVDYIDDSEATKHIRKIKGEIAALSSMSKDELYVAAKELQAPYDVVVEIAQTGKLPVVLFTAGGVATPADAAMMMQLGAEGVFVGSGIFKSGSPVARAKAIVQATTFFDDPDVIAKVSRGLGEAMVGINVPPPQADRNNVIAHRLAERGW